MDQVAAWCSSRICSVSLTIQSICTAPIEAILRKRRVRYHKFAEDLQIYVFFDLSKPGDREA